MLDFINQKNKEKQTELYFTEDDKRQLYLAAMLHDVGKMDIPLEEDGMVIIVYSKKEVLNYLETLEKEVKKNSLCHSSNISNDACITNSNIDKNDTNNSLININTASLNELMTLTGIGESKAKNIISYRERTPFNKIEDILNVDGIGESIYVNIKKNITV